MSDAPPITPAAFRTLATAHPDQAKKWLKRVVEEAGPVLSDAARAQLAELKGAGQVFERKLKSVRALYSPTAAVPNQTPARLPVVHGTLAVARGTKMVRGDQDYRDWPNLRLTLTTPDGRSFRLDSDNEDHQDVFTYIPGTDVMAFDGMEVSVRGWLDRSGKTLRVTELAPGHLDDFVFGRVVVQENKVYVRPRGRELVELTHPGLVAQLRNRERVGVILPGEVRETSLPGRPKALSYAGNPGEYWILMKMLADPTPKTGSPGISTGEAEAGLSTVHPTVVLPTTEVGKIEVGDRMYVLGSFDGDTLNASRATPSAGSPWRVAKAKRGNPLQSLIRLTEV